MAIKVTYYHYQLWHLRRRSRWSGRTCTLGMRSQVQRRFRASHFPAMACQSLDRAGNRNEGAGGGGLEWSVVGWLVWAGSLRAVTHQTSAVTHRSCRVMPVAARRNDAVLLKEFTCGLRNAHGDEIQYRRTELSG